MRSTQVLSDAKLAIDGGPKAFARQHGPRRPKIGVEEFMSIAERFGFSDDTLERIRLVISVDDLGDGPTLSRFLTAHPPHSKGEAFERAAREIFGCKHALSTSSGTGALHSAMVAVGVGPGREVIVPAIGFFATAATVVAAKGVPIFCDVDESLCIDPEKIEACITPRTVAVAPTCVMGAVPDMDPILEIARKHSLKVIEDCAQAPGAKYKGRCVGTLGDVGCFSISAYKIVGGGEGGLLLTDDNRLYERACQLAECGGLTRPDRFAPPRYEGELFCGTNYRMSELEAAVNVVQIRKMPSLITRYNTIRNSILSKLKTFKEIVPQKIHDPDGGAGYMIRFFPETIELGRKIAAALNAEGIGIGRFLWPAECAVRGKDAPPDWHVYKDMFAVMLQTDPAESGCPFSCPAYHEKGGRIEYNQGDCPVADDLFDRNIQIWLDSGYDEEDCRNIAAGINKVLSAYCMEDENGRQWI
ncbi:MAG: aminotransferase class V-fold PLP-dependent enzyme [Pirellulales bacterium]|nr:aminotransferase class V-fold PLP-dependent enzyme [Pirellulales bacterium]